MARDNDQACPPTGPCTRTENKLRHAALAARAEAETMAKAAGGSLGEVIELSEGGEFGIAAGFASQRVVRGTTMSPRDLTPVQPPRAA